MNCPPQPASQGFAALHQIIPWQLSYCSVPLTPATTLFPTLTPTNTFKNNFNILKHPLSLFSLILTYIYWGVFLHFTHKLGFLFLFFIFFHHVGILGFLETMILASPPILGTPASSTNGQFVGLGLPLFQQGSEFMLLPNILKS